MKFKPTTERILIDCLLLVLVIFIPYHVVAQHTFTDYDDNAYLFQNRHIVDGLTWDSIAWAFTTTENANWHPLTWISHLIDHDLFGDHPGGYLLMNVAWHTLATCLCYLAFLRCTASRVFALTVALIFALHPVNVENVAWASERKSLLNAAFWFAAIISYLDFIETKSFRAYGLSVIFFILSLFAKAMSVTLPCTLALIHCLYLVYHPAKLSLQKNWFSHLKRIIAPTLPLLLLSLYFSAITASAQSITMPINYPLAARAINALLSYGRYLVMFFHPTELAVFYPLNFDGQLVVADLLAGLSAAVVLFVITGGVLLLAKKKPQLLIGWCWFLGTMVPAIGLVQVGAQSHADRYLYIPMLGLAFLLPTLFEMLRSFRIWATNAAIVASLLVLGSSMLLATKIQVSYWKDGVTLCLHSLDVTGYCFSPALSLSMTCTRTGRFEEFIAYIDGQIAITESQADRAIMAILKANVLYRMGKYPAAIESAQHSIAWGRPTKASYALIALSNHELGEPGKAKAFLDGMKSIQDLKIQNSLLVFSLKSHIDILELQLRPPLAN